MHSNRILITLGKNHWIHAISTSEINMLMEELELINVKERNELAHYKACANSLLMGITIRISLKHLNKQTAHNIEAIWGTYDLKRIKK